MGRAFAEEHLWKGFDLSQKTFELWGVSLSKGVQEWSLLLSQKTFVLWHASVSKELSRNVVSKERLV